MKSLARWSKWWHRRKGAKVTERSPTITNHGFRWIGQSWECCDECGRPAREHSGIDEPCREHMFCAHPSTIKPFTPTVAAMKEGGDNDDVE